MPPDASSTLERRIEPRWPAARAQFVLWSPMLHQRLELVDFSSRGLAFRVPSSSSIDAGSDVSLVLENRGGLPIVHLVARAASLMWEGAKVRVGGPIEGFTLAPRRSRWVPAKGDLVSVRSSAHRQQILSSARKHRIRATLWWPPR